MSDENKNNKCESKDKCKKEVKIEDENLNVSSNEENNGIGYEITISQK